MSEEDLTDILGAAKDYLKQNWASPSFCTYKTHVLFMLQRSKDPRVWVLHVFGDGDLVHTIEFEPSP